MTRSRPIMQSDPDVRSIAIDGSPVFTGADLHLEEALERACNLGRPALVVTPNVDQVLNLDQDRHFRMAFARADLRLLDGMPLVFLARMLGVAGVPRVTGADFLPYSATFAANRGWTVALTGGSDGTSRAAAEALNQQARASVAVSVPFPRLDSVDDPRSREVVEQLSRLRPQIVFVGLGSPKQELWFERWRNELPPAVYVGSGAAADFAAGVRNRAPSWAQELALEWLWRLAQEPRRLAGRYLIRGPAFLSFGARSIGHHLGQKSQALREASAEVRSDSGQ